MAERGALVVTPALFFVSGGVMTVVAMDDDTRERLVARLFRAFSMQLSDIEARIAEKGGDGIVEDAKVLSGLAKTLETLVTVERRVNQGEQGEDTLDYDAVRTQLAARLLSLRLGDLGPGEDEELEGDSGGD